MFNNYKNTFHMLRGKSILFCAGLVVASVSLQAQLLYNGGTQVAVTGGGVLYVEGAVENANGLFSNAGYTTVNGYFKNGGTATGGGAATGVYYVSGDWINNSTFTADQSNVVLDGSSQSITGSSASTFYNLTLNTPGSVKTQTIDANVNNIDSLNDCELATGDYKMNILNADPAAIVRGVGFVSSTGPGRLTRAANTTNTYLFPTGWNDNGNIVYRPVEMSPSDANPQTFNVRLAYDNPTSENYDTATKAGNVTLVNGKYFHLIKQIGSTSPADLTIYYDPSADGQWSSIGRWQDLPQWTDLANTTTATGSPLSSRTKPNWKDDGNEPHALINAVIVTTLFTFPNVFDPGSNDPLNSTFHVIDFGTFVTVQAMRIYDRWGEIVYDSQRDGTMRSYYGANTYAWDGTYQGKKQLMGNYIYTASIKINETGEVKTVSGNLALVR